MANGSSIADSWQRIKGVLEQSAEGRFVLLTVQSPADESRITAFENETGVNLPDDVKAMCRLFDGQTDDPEVELEEDDGLDEIEEMSPGLLPSIESDDLAFMVMSLEMMTTDIEESHESTMPGWRMGWLPIGTNFGGDNIVVDLSDGSPRPGRVLQFDHEMGGAYEIADSLGAYFARLADDLEAGRVIFDGECGLVPAEGLNFNDLHEAGKLEFAEEDEE